MTNIHNALESAYMTDCFDFEIIEDAHIRIFVDEIEGFLEYFAEELVPSGEYAYSIDYGKYESLFDTQVDLIFTQQDPGVIVASTPEGDIKITIHYEE